MSTEKPDPQSKKSFWQKARLATAAIGALLVLVIVLQNTQPVETKLLFVTLTMPWAGLLLGTLFIGFALGYLVAQVRFQRARKQTELRRADTDRSGTA